MDSMAGKDVQASAQGDGSAFKKNHRIEFINSLFADTYCLFERMEGQRLFYFFIVNCACALSEAFFVDTVRIEMADMQVAVENQKKILQISKDIYKKFHDNNQEYKRKPLSTKTPPMGKVRNEVIKANAPEFSALRHGTSKWYQKAKATFWQGLNLVMGLVFFFFVVKNQALPIIRKKFGLYKSVLLEKESV